MGGGTLSVVTQSRRNPIERKENEQDKSKNKLDDEDAWFSSIAVESDGDLRIDFLDLKLEPKLDDGLELSFTNRRKFAKPLETPLSSSPETLWGAISEVRFQR
ncbi:hypothetical protein YC2023_099506 [Brassica napus]